MEKKHPDDRDTGNPEKFNLISNGYKTLADPEKRAAYDANYEEVKTSHWKALSKVTSSNGYETDKQI